MTALCIGAANSKYVTYTLIKRQLSRKINLNEQETVHHKNESTSNMQYKQKNVWAASLQKCSQARGKTGEATDEQRLSGPVNN